MPSGKQQAVDLAKKIAKQVAAEPLEVLKAAENQIIGTPEIAGNQRQENPEKHQQELAARQEKVKQKDSSLLKALESEIGDIRKQDLLQTIQSKIANGEPVSLEEYPQLSPEQRQMLESQIQMAKAKAQQQEQTEEGIPTPSSKPSRRMGQKQAAQKEQTRVEKPVPPSG